jgi:hypothetical protein
MINHDIISSSLKKSVWEADVSQFIETPNIPDKAVSLAVVDGRVCKDAGAAFAKRGVRLLKTGRHLGLYDAVTFHPDMQIHHIGGNVVVFAPGTDESLLASLRGEGFKLLAGETELSPNYPLDIAYNAARVGGFYFHYLRYTDPVLKRELEKSGIQPINVAQGYTKCSVSIIGPESIITADCGIAAAAEKAGIDVLLINSRQNISLPGMNTGFIGGCSGMLDKDTWAVFGNPETLADFKRIYRFLSERKIHICQIMPGQVTDYGSIIPLLTV